MSKLLKWVGGAVALLLALVAVALVLPFLVDLNKFKPQIQAAVSQQTNAQVDFESARLTILTGLGVKLSKVSVVNTDPTFKGTKLFSVDDVVFYTELGPLLKKRFVGTVVIDKPEIVFATHGLKSNITA